MEDPAVKGPGRMDRNELKELLLKRLQRTAEYTLLIAMHAFFLISFRGFYAWWMAVALGVITFGLNFQLTMLRERRRLATGEQRPRILADTFESLLFLALIILISAGEPWALSHHLTEPEYLGYVAALLSGIFLAGLFGEFYWQRKYFQTLDDTTQRAYIANLKRTIIVPYIASRSR
jgi:hypothetical protein